MATTVPPFSDLSGVLIILAATAHVCDQDSTLPVWMHWGAVCGVCVTNGYMSSADSHHLTGHHAEAQPPGLHRRSQSSQCLTAPVQWPGPDRGPLRPLLTWRLLLRKENKRTNGTFGRWWRHWNTQTAVLGGVFTLSSLWVQAQRDALSLNHFVSSSASFWASVSTSMFDKIRLTDFVLWCLRHVAVLERTPPLPHACTY